MNTSFTLFFRFVSLLLVGFVLGAAVPVGALASPGRLLVAGVDEALEAAARVSGRSLGHSARREAGEALARAVRSHGDGVLDATRRGGIELLETAAKHGDEILEWAGRHPAAARALAREGDELVPLVRRHGEEILALEAKYPGTAAEAARLFGGEGIEYLVRNPVETEDYVRLLGFAKRADSPDTARRLLEGFQEHGGRFLDRLDAKKIIASGLGAGMLVSAWNLSDGAADAMRDTPAVLPFVTGPIALAAIAGCGVLLAAMALVFLWKTGRLKSKGSRTAQARES